MRYPPVYALAQLGNWLIRVTGMWLLCSAYI
jgi:hypothetical protein